MPIKNLVLKPAAVSSVAFVEKTRYYRGFSTVFNSQNSKLYDLDLVRQDLLNHFNTRRGERVMNPSFGSIIWDIIFDPLTDELKSDISDDIRQILYSDPRIIPENVNFYEREHGIIIEITVRYTESDQSEVLKLTFDKEKGIAF